MKIQQSDSSRLNLLLWSALALYAESVLIRWIGSEIRMFAYLKNFTLLAVFLGLGIGMLKQHKSRLTWLMPALMSLLTLLLVFSSRLHLTYLFFPDPGIAQWQGSINSPSAVLLARRTPLVGSVFRALPDSLVPWVLGAMAFAVGALLFIIIVMIFSAIGQRIGELLKSVKPSLNAYTLNLVGSLLGTLLFVTLIFFGLPPWVWFLPIFLCLLYFSDRRLRDGLLLAAPLLAALVVSSSDRVVWSPYYRLGLTPEYGNAYELSVDHDFHQDALDLRPAAIQAYPFLSKPLAYYDLAYKLAPNCNRALVIGAGTGNDVSAALRAGCASIDAVEIDPAILKLGHELHPERPYDSPRVHAYVNDGRAFFHQALAQGKTYDLIVFGLVDSHQALSVVSSLRLEFLLYSLESFKEARALLDQKDGVFVLGFSVGWRDWVSQRLYNTLSAAFEQSPMAVRSSNYVEVLSFVAGPGLTLAEQRMTTLPTVSVATSTVAGSDVGIVRDDWPYLYYNPKALPLVYMASLLLVIAFGWIAVRRASGSLAASSSGIDWPMFFMGAAFLLVETKNISQTAILFGATWVTNVVVFIFVFLLAIAANLIVIKRPVANLPTLYGGLGISLLLSYFVPFSTLTQLPLLSRAIVGGMVTALPVLFSSLIFSKMFKETQFPQAALGSNILGGLLGGGLEALSMFTGIRAMALVAIAIYGASWIAFAARGHKPAFTPQLSLQQQ